MLNLPEQFILYDTEFTAWEGSRERKWNAEGEHREIVQIGAIKVSNDLEEVGNFVCFVKPIINPVLSKYFIDLTGIEQQKVDEEGIDFKEAIRDLKTWSGDQHLYSFGRDDEVILENCELNSIECPFTMSSFFDIRDQFKEHGIPTEEYFSSTIVRAFGEEPSRTGHEALNDARTILDALRLLKKQIN